MRDAVDEVLREGGYQTEIPTDVVAPDWLMRFLRWLGSLLEGAGGAGVIELLFWVVTAVVLLFLLLFLLRWLFSEWQHRRRKSAKEQGGVEEVPVLDLGPLPDPEALAGAGEYAAAVHALLLNAQQTLVTRLKFDLRVALTSREVLNRVEIRDQAEEELRGLVLAVEVSRFGGAAVGRGDFDRCSGRYVRFVAAIVVGGR